MLPAALKGLGLFRCLITVPTVPSGDSGNPLTDFALTRFLLFSDLFYIVPPNLTPYVRGQEGAGVKSLFCPFVLITDLLPVVFFLQNHTHTRRLSTVLSSSLKHTHRLQTTGHRTLQVFIEIITSEGAVSARIM